MKKVCVFFALCLVLLISGCSVGDSGKNDWRQEIVAIYGSHLVLAQDADENKFAGHRWTAIFEEIKEIRKRNQDLRMRAYSINTAGFSEQDKQGIVALRGALDSFDSAVLGLLCAYEEGDRVGQYSTSYQEKYQNYQSQWSNYLAQRNKVKEYISPTPKNTSSNKSK